MEFLKGITVFGPQILMQIQEAPLNHHNKQLPHGNLDILVVTPAYSTITQIGVLIIDGDTDKVVLTSSMKAEAAIKECGSGKCAFFYM